MTEKSTAAGFAATDEELRTVASTQVPHYLEWDEVYHDPDRELLLPPKHLMDSYVDACCGFLITVRDAEGLVGMSEEAAYDEAWEWAKCHAHELELWAGATANVAHANGLSNFLMPVSLEGELALKSAEDILAKAVYNQSVATRVARIKELTTRASDLFLEAAAAEAALPIKDM